MLVSKGEHGRRELRIPRRDGVEDGSIDLICMDDDRLATGDVDNLFESGAGDNGTGGILRVAEG